MSEWLPDFLSLSHLKKPTTVGVRVSLKNQSVRMSWDSQSPAESMSPRGQEAPGIPMLLRVKVFYFSELRRSWSPRGSE